MGYPKVGGGIIPEIISSISKLVVPSGERGAEAVWMPTTTVKFTLSSAYQEVQQAQNRSFVYSHRWRPNLPVKVSFLMLRLMRGRLPLDKVLCNIGFQLPSKCFYCAAAAVETIEHVFFTGGLALELAATSAQGRFLYATLPSWICWHIWKARNKAVFEGVRLQGSEVCQAIFRDVKAVFEIQFHQLMDVHTFPELYDAIAVAAPLRYGILIMGWKPSEAGQLTLNTDGCSKGNLGMSGGGGVLRNSNGELVVAFSAFLGKQSSLRAEVLALLAGVQLCEARRMATPFVQLDFGILVGILQRRFHSPWYVRMEVEEIWQRVAVENEVSYCVREANKVADALANVGDTHIQDSLRIYDSFQAIPVLARGELRLDQWRLPAIRRVKRNMRGQNLSGA
ncbi:uncharacterized protein LOC113769901 [Coffea eugenioides]|uniref:uncharacterized protein LOC113769901 n=1 Tax=Coffea eugenioides TaxID=49369 RepID=UPI000F60667D|nr:uncharacterized protein LOC113769901 [Coffea eugenioides]